MNNKKHEMKRRSSFKTFTPKDGKDAVGTTTKSSRRISFSEKKSVRLFFGEEMPKTWNKTYEESDRVDSSGSSNLITTNVCSKINEPDLDTFSANKENIKLDNIPTRSSNSLTENNSVNNTVDSINKTQQQSTVYINNTLDITLLPREKFIKKNKPNLSFTLDEEEIKLLQNMRNQKENQEPSKPISEKKQLENLLRNTFVEQAETIHSLICPNKPTNSNLNEIINNTVREVKDIELSMSFDDSTETTPVLVPERKTKPIYTPFKSKDHIGSDTLNMDISAAIEYFDEKLNRMSFKSDSDQSSDFEVNFNKNLCDEKQKMEMSNNVLGGSNRRTIYCNENIVPETNVDLCLANANIQKTIAFEEKLNDMSISFTCINSGEVQPLQNFAKATDIVKEPIVQTKDLSNRLTCTSTETAAAVQISAPAIDIIDEPIVSKIALKSGSLITRKTFKSNLRGGTPASNKKQRYQKKQEEIQDDENENIRPADIKTAFDEGNPLESFTSNLSLSSPILPPELMCYRKMNLKQLNSNFESGKITLKCRNPVEQNSLKQVGRKLFSPLKQESDSMKITDNEMISPKKQNTNDRSVPAQKCQKVKNSLLDLNEKTKQEENFCELSMFDVDDADFAMKTLNENQGHLQLTVNKEERVMENISCEDNCEDEMDICYVRSPTTQREINKESANALKHMFVTEKKDDLSQSFDSLQIDNSMKLLNKQKFTPEDDTKKDFKNNNSYKQQLLKTKEETETKQRKTIHFSDQISLDDQIEPFSETQYLLGNFCEKLHSPNQLQQRHTIFFKDGLNLEFESNQRNNEKNNSKRAEVMPMLSETQYLLEDINDIDTEFSPINCKPNKVTKALEEKTICFTKESNIEIGNDKDSVVKHHSSDIKEESFIMNIQSPTESKEILVNNMKDKFKNNLKNTPKRQTMFFLENSSLDMEDVISDNKKCRSSKAVAFLPHKTQILEDSIDEAQTATPPIEVLSLSKNKVKRKTIIFADEAIENTKNILNKRDDYILPKNSIKLKMPKVFSIETPHKSLIEFEDIEKECAEDISYVCMQQEESSKMVQCNKIMTKRQTTYENTELEVSGLQLINNFEVTSLPATSPVVLKKRFTECITPNFPNPKKRQTMLFHDNMDIDGDTTTESNTIPNSTRRNTVVFNKDISMNDDVHNKSDENKNTKTAIEGLNITSFELKSESDKLGSVSKKSVETPLQNDCNQQECIVLSSPSWLCISNTTDANASNESLVNDELVEEIPEKSLTFEDETMGCKSLDVSMENVIANESNFTPTAKLKSRIPIPVNSEVKNNSIGLTSLTTNCEKTYTNSSLAPIEIARKTNIQRKDSIFELLENDTILLEDTKMPEDNLILEENAITITDVSQYPLRRTNIDNITVCDSEIVDKIHLSLVDTYLDDITNNKENKSVNTEDVKLKNIDDKNCDLESRNNHVSIKRRSVCRKCRNCHETMVSDTTTLAVSFELPEFLPLPTMERLKKLRSTKRPTIDDMVEYNRRMSLNDSFDIEHLSAIDVDVDEEEEANYVDEADEIIKAYENKMESARQEYLQLKAERLMKDRRSFVERLDDKLNEIAKDWIFNYQNLNLYQFNHKKVTIFCLEVAYNETNLSRGIEIESIKVKDNNFWPKKNWLPIDYVINFQLKLELPYDLRNWCKSHEEMIILNMLVKVDDVCQDISKMIRKLWYILFTQNANLIRDDNKICVEKILRRVEAYKRYCISATTHVS
ncbi:uncharacterized protein LOC119679108 isoform X2 [Teleopsis dalmanni]|uniref:uncharacterized protein LOC119679108 isoform X2 n=1 Tax=Teleopsis dalmanni TaxID=139649 RepID=UPI0018CFD9E5|nr:uncharacterized protein LOC119679108 isoform X2 [Teleopsis dalmanni]